MARTLISVKVGRGVLGKDGTPFNVGVAYVRTYSTHVDQVWQSPIDYTPEAIMQSLVDGDVVGIVVIDTENVQYDVKIERG